MDIQRVTALNGFWNVMQTMLRRWGTKLVNFKKWAKRIQTVWYTVFPHIVSTLEQFPPLNSFAHLCTAIFGLMYCDLWISKSKKEQCPWKLYEDILYLFVFLPLLDFSKLKLFFFITVRFQQVKKNICFFLITVRFCGRQI